MRSGNRLTTDNPYQSNNVTLSPREDDCRPSKRALWLAYFWAPAVAPLSFVGLLFVVGIVATWIGVEINPASFLVLPVVALTIGLAACYLVAGIIGMPIAFYLRRAHALNGYTIHGAAFCWAVLFSAACAAVVMHGKWNDFLLVFGYFGAGVAPPVLLSATAFWWLLRRFARMETQD